MKIAFDVSGEDLAEAILDSLGHSDTLDLILAIDLAMADVGFTEDLLKRLIKSIRTDYATPKDFAEFVAELAKVEK